MDSGEETFTEEEQKFLIQQYENLKTPFYYEYADGWAALLPVSYTHLQYIHFDVMDGMFVPSISFGMPVLKSIHDTTEQIMDAHLMVQEPCLLYTSRCV